MGLIDDYWRKRKARKQVRLEGQRVLEKEITRAESSPPTAATRQRRRTSRIAGEFLDMCKPPRDP